VFWVGKTGQFDEEGGGGWFLWDDDCKTLFVSEIESFLLMFGAQGKV